MNKILTCVYKACPFEVKPYKVKCFRPNYFNKMKCFKLFWDNFNNIYTDVIVVWDGNVDNELYNYIKQFDLKIVHNKTQGNIPSLLMCYDVIKDIKTPLGYLIEDDYGHTENSFDILLDGFYFSDLISLYDHPDRYGEMGKQDTTYQKEIIYTGRNIHYRTAESTTCSFGFKKACFDKYRQSLINAALRGDGSPDDRGWWREMIKNGYRLVTPLPGYSTHLVSGLESPFINWEKIFNDAVL